MSWRAVAAPFTPFSQARGKSVADRHAAGHDAPPETVTMRQMSTTCCVVGGGPAGMMLGLLMARAGIDVVVLEKHADFLRDFRGDTVHPSTLQLMHELGLLDRFLARPHQELRSLSADIGGEVLRLVDFTHLPTRCKFVALMPQWEFLDFLSGEAKRFSNFHLLMRTEGTGLLREADRVVGVAAQSPDGPLEIRAALVVATDGRHSTMRDASGRHLIEHGSPMDVLWLRLSRRDDDPAQTLGHVRAGRMLVTLDRGDYWQCAFVIAKGGFDVVRSAGLENFRADILHLAPHFADRVAEIADWDQVKLLTVAVNRLEQWELPGLLLIGDAAHAMSPIGGVGINLAIQDAVAAANILVPKLRAGGVTQADLHAVQRRRELPTKLTQAMQTAIQNRVISNVLRATATPRPPWFARMLDRIAILRRIPARVLGMGFRPEHVRI
jgi:2-polyprenyl-6-methoxyphenol hydroxylase-like FAD-dependent oxidoreductase